MRVPSRSAWCSTCREARHDHACTGVDADQYLPAATRPRSDVCRRHGAGPVSGETRRRCAVSLADAQGAPRQHARLRHLRPCRRQSRPGHGRGSRATVVGGRAPGPAADGRHRAQPHGRRSARQSLVARSAGERAVFAVCRVLRHRLGSDHAAPAPEGPAAHPGRSVRRRARPRRAADRVRGWSPLAAVLRASPADQPAADAAGVAPRRAGADGVARRWAPGGDRVPEHPRGPAQPAPVHRHASRAHHRPSAREGSAARAPAAPGGRHAARDRGDDARRGAHQRARRGTGFVRRTACTARGPALSTGLVAHGGGRDQLPSLLRRQRAGGRARRTRGRVRRHAPVDRHVAARRPRARAAPRSPRWPVRPRGLFRAPAAVRPERDRPEGPAVRGRREDSRARRAPARRLAGAWDDRLCVPERDQRPVHRPGRPASIAAGPCPHHRRARAVARDRLRRQAADHGYGDVERARRARRCARAHCPRRSPHARLHAQQPARADCRVRRVHPRLPDVRQRARLDAGRPRDHRPDHCRGPAAQSRDGGLAVPLPARGAAAGALVDAARRAWRAVDVPASAGVRDEAPAVHRPRAGQGRRGHHVLSLQRAGLDERGRRRSRHHRAVGGGGPCRQRHASTLLAGRDDDAVHARHETRRGRAGTHQRLVGDGRRLA